MNSSQEPKYKIGDGIKLVNRQSGEAIPDDEPIFIFRARDILAAQTLWYYATLVAKADPNMQADEHLEAILIRWKQFRNFSAVHPDRMKQPDTQLNGLWKSSLPTGEEGER